MIWVDISPDLPGYKANMEGQVLSLKGAVPRILKTKLDKKRGYLRVRLHKDGWSRDFDLHQLITMAFHGPRPEPWYQACHNDGNKLNCRAGNLRWDTPAANAADSMKHGTSPGVAIAARTKCNHGHDFTPENTYMRPGYKGKLYRMCRRCQIDRSMVCHKRRKQGLTPTPWPGKGKPKPKTEAEWDAWKKAGL